MIEVGQKAPEFTLRDHDGEDATLDELRGGGRLLIVFYPLDFSPVCSDQLSLYERSKAEIDGRGVRIVGISVDSHWAHNAFREKLGLEATLLSDFEPKGEVARAYGSYLDGPGIANRTLVLIDADGVVAWTYESPSPGEFPGVDVVLDGIS